MTEKAVNSRGRVSELSAVTHGPHVALCKACIDVLHTYSGLSERSEKGSCCDLSKVYFCTLRVYVCILKVYFCTFESIPLYSASALFVF